MQYSAAASPSRSGASSEPWSSPRAKASTCRLPATRERHASTSRCAIASGTGSTRRSPAGRSVAGRLNRAVPDHPALSQPRLRGAGRPLGGVDAMALTVTLLVQALQIGLVLALAPLLTGFVRKVKARLLRRRGPSVIQPYRDLLRLLRKDAVVPRTPPVSSAPRLISIFAAIWAAASLVPTFATGFPSAGRPTWSPSSRCSAARRFFLALAGHGCRNQLRRHRLEPRDDDRLARRAGDDDDRLHGGAARRLDPALHHRRTTCCPPSSA